MKKWGLMVAATALVAVLAGCGGSSSSAPATTVELKAADTAFASKELKVTKGQAVKLVLDNEDSQLHDFVVDKIPVKLKESGSKDHGHSSTSSKADLHVAAEAGQHGEVEFTATTAGTYTYYCSVPGHKDAGMTGKLIVN